jgi:alginate production protein
MTERASKVAVAGLVLCLAWAPAQAQYEQGERVSPWSFSSNLRTFDFEEPEPLDRRSLDRTFIRARFGARYQQTFADDWLFDGEARVAVQHRERPDQPGRTDEFIDIKRLHFRGEALFASPFLAFDGGRFRLQDHKGWLFDTDIEAAQIGYESTLVNARVGIASWLWDGRFGLDFSTLDGDDPVATGSDYLFFEYQYQWRYDHFLGLNIVFEDYELPDEISGRISDPDDLTVNSELTWLTLETWGARQFKHFQLDYALSLGTVSGDRQFLLLNQDSRIDFARDQHLSSGVGWDFKLAARFLENRFALGVGIAGGDGDSPLQSSSASFVQPQASTNKDNVIGVRRYRYYGEVLAPKLNNIRIGSVWAGYSFKERFWLEAALHDYRQEVATGLVLSDTSIFLPNGLSRDLGTGVDLVLGGRIRQNVNLLLVAGAFLGGDAFDGVTLDPDGYRITAEIDVRW